MSASVPRLSVAVDAVPEPGLLRPAVEAVLAGRAWPPGPERTVAEAVRAATIQATGGATPARAHGAGGDDR